METEQSNMSFRKVRKRVVLTIKFSHYGVELGHFPIKQPRFFMSWALMLKGQLPHPLLAMVKEEFPNIQLIMIRHSIGDETYQDRLQTIIMDENFDDRVIFTELVPIPKLPVFYPLVDIFFLSSRYHQVDIKGSGVVLIEANLMRTPVIDAISGSAVNPAENLTSGYLYACENAEDLAKKTYLSKSEEVSI